MISSIMLCANRVSTPFSEAEAERRWPGTCLGVPLDPFCPSPDPAEPRRRSGEALLGEELPF
ncbi:hypothetical protein E2C01_097309 [Portunus trituberculatus]|uniref:Uncharacterized protein n=1 Tax=Portunus trituberculatus TaxID=210409 RepID=A0A5B7K4A8_PORTR|nr:hypothetical protein [Portunus trituberculatus]